MDSEKFKKQCAKCTEESSSNDQMYYEVGDKIIITDTGKVYGSHMRQIPENVEYLVISVDDTDGCPAIMVENRINFLSVSEIPYTKHANRASREEINVTQKMFPYIPPNKEMEELLIRLEFNNWGRAVDIAIDVALEKKDHDSFMRLIKQK